MQHPPVVPQGHIPPRPNLGIVQQAAVNISPNVPGAVPLTHAVAPAPVPAAAPALPVQQQLGQVAVPAAQPAVPGVLQVAAAGPQVQQQLAVGNERMDLSQLQRFVLTQGRRVQFNPKPEYFLPGSPGQPQ